MRRVFAISIVCLWSFAHAQEGSELPVEPVESESPPEEVLVTGEFPGPGMWQVIRPDDPENHTLWILGTPPPLPKKMKWKSSEVEARMRASQEILLNSRIDVEPDKRIGLFRGLSLLPAALAARKNPDEQTLKELLPEELYAAWLVQKKRYLGNDRGIERWRPIFAAYKLREEAFDDIGYRDRPRVWDALEKIAKKHKIPTTQPMLKFAIKTAEIKSKIKAFAHEDLADEECFAVTLQLTEALADREMMQTRANAWATGDLQLLKQLSTLPNPNVACEAAVMSSQIAQQSIPSDLRAQLSTLWIEAAEKSLATNVSTFALLPYSELTRPDGRLAILRAKGYVIDEPEATE